jgi:two-component system, LytTR family, response regulator LytT
MKTLIIEGDPIWQLKIRMIIEQYDYEVIGIAEHGEDIELILNTDTPDLVLADIVLSDGYSFDFLKQANYNGIIVFLTGLGIDKYVTESLNFCNSTFLVKPFHDLSLIAAIETLKRHQFQKTTFPPILSTTVALKNDQTLFTIGKYRQKIQIPLDKVIYLKADGNYVISRTADRNNIHRCSLKKVSKILDFNFIQIHKAFVINKIYLNRVDLARNEVNVNGFTLPIGRAYKKDFLLSFQN